MNEADIFLFFKSSKTPRSISQEKSGHDYIRDNGLKGTHIFVNTSSEIVYQISMATSQRPLGIFLRKNRTWLY